MADLTAYRLALVAFIAGAEDTLDRVIHAGNILPADDPLVTAHPEWWAELDADNLRVVT